MKAAEKSDWKAYDIPKQHDTFYFQRNFTDAQMAKLRHGNIPEAMEDKWFWYMDDNTLFAHRSWTGFCIYIIEFSTTGKHRVLVNRDPDQYKSSQGPHCSFPFESNCRYGLHTHFMAFPVFTA